MHICVREIVCVVFVGVSGCLHVCIILCEILSCNYVFVCARDCECSVKVFVSICVCEIVLT